MAWGKKRRMIEITMKWLKVTDYWSMRVNCMWYANLKNKYHFKLTIWTTQRNT